MAVVSNGTKQSKILDSRASRGHFRHLHEICFTTHWSLSQKDVSRPRSWPQRVTKKCRKYKTLQNRGKSLVSEALVAIFGIYAKFASQRNGRCLQRTLLEPVRGHNVSRKKAGNAKTFKTEGNPWFPRLSWPFSESTQNLLHNALILISIRAFRSHFGSSHGLKPFWLKLLRVAPHCPSLCCLDRGKFTF